MYKKLLAGMMALIIMLGITVQPEVVYALSEDSLDGADLENGQNVEGIDGFGSMMANGLSDRFSEDIASVCFGDYHSGLITKDGGLYMWGDNSSGEVGNGTTEDQTRPVKILDNIETASLGRYHSGAITKDGSLYMWGSNSFGQIGNGEVGTGKDCLSPVKILEDVASASLGTGYSSAVTKDGSLYMWGSNDYGQIGNGKKGGSAWCTSPEEILQDVVSISLGHNHSGAVTKNGDLYMWGHNNKGQIGDGATADCTVPVKVMENVASFSIGYNHSGAVTKNGDLYMWGSNLYRQVGNGKGEDQLNPVKVLENVMSFSLGDYHSCAITKDGNLYMWGRDTYDLAGGGVSEPTMILDNVASVYTGMSLHSGAITNDGDLYMWGYNKHGQIGDGTAKDQARPEKVLEHVASAGIGSYHSGAITEDGSLYMWGYNSSGQIGDGTTEDQLSPVKISGNFTGGDDGSEAAGSYIVQRVARYASDELYEQFHRINISNYPEETKFQKFYELFSTYGFTDVREGIAYVSKTTAERDAYCMLTTDDFYLASQYVYELNNTERGKAMRAALVASGLIFNSEWKTWTNPLLITSSYGETPGVKKYKAMLYDYMQEQSKKSECADYIKTVVNLTDKVVGTTKETILKEVNESGDPQKILAILKKYPNELIPQEDGGVVKEFTFDDKSGFGKFLKMEGYASTVLSIGETLWEDYIDFVQLDGKLNAYVENKEFLDEVIHSADDLPSGLRYAAYLVREEMELGKWGSFKDFTLDIMNETLKVSKLTKNMFTEILAAHGLSAPGALTKFLAEVDVAVWFSNKIIDMGSVVKKEAYVEGYAYLAKHFTKLLEQDKEAFLKSSTEGNAWKFYDTYCTLYQIRKKGEESYLAMCNVKGLAGELAKKGIHYEWKEEVVNNILEILKDRCQFTLPEGMEMPESVPYYSKCVVQCPVDVEVMGPSGNVIIRLLDKVESDVTNPYGRFAVVYMPYTGNYAKVVCLNQDSECSVHVVGADTGLVNLEMALKTGQEASVYKISHEAVSNGTVISIGLAKDSVDTTGLSYQKWEEKDPEKIEEKAMDRVLESQAKVAVSKIKLDQEEIELRQGEQTLLQVAVDPADAGNQRVRWVSGDSSVALVKDGKVSAVGEGETMIYCISLDNLDISTQCSIKVKPSQMIDLYTISYDLNGGNVTGNPSSYTADALPITLRVPARSGYTFTGWTGSNGNVPQASVTIPKDTTGDLNYTANWKQVNSSGGDTPGYTGGTGGNIPGYTGGEISKSTYTISYTLNGGDVTGNPSSYTAVALPITLKEPVRSGYVFIGWTGSNGNVPQKTVTIPKGMTGKLSYTANWKQDGGSGNGVSENMYTISYTLNGGNVTGNPASYKSDILPITLKNPVRNGYTFIGWTGSNGNTPQTTVVIPKGTIGELSYTANFRENGSVNPRIKIEKVSLKKTSYIYDGKKKKPPVIVKAGKEKLKKGTDYTVTYKYNRKVGTAFVIVRGTGEYTGKVVKKFKIAPKGTSISRIVAKPGGFVVGWRKQAESSDGYQIQYSVDRKFTKKTIVAKTVKKPSKAKLNVRKCKAGKKYYIRVRTYKTVKGKKYFSRWSKVKKLYVNNL